MKNLEKFYRTEDGSKVILGNGSELIAVKAKPMHSFHVRSRDGEPVKERAIRYNYDSAMDVATQIASEDVIVTVVKRPIFAESADC